MINAVRVDFAKGGGLVPVVVQDRQSGAVLMLGYMNREALDRTLASGNLHFWSRSRREIWLKGKRSGNLLQVARLAVDCDGDTLLAEVTPATGETPVCHTGAETCFFTELISSVEGSTLQEDVSDGVQVGRDMNEDG